ncbi:MAG: hypothetical protein CMF89_02850 [Candidatus Marinimicrobia bacterium]|nr:hypothetical protein [Candidatus Neomarinimicrobiota bacterium]|tara:strand:- start:1807 stop:2124 length:318 start_codon:yes stop_codon:yes gene_type:complete
MVLKRNKKMSSSKDVSLSNSNNKRAEMLVKIDSMLEEIDSKYGPYILEELQKRIEFTIEEFFNDLKIVLENVFDKSNSLSVNQDNNQMETPVFIAEHNKKRTKKK